MYVKAAIFGAAGVCYATVINDESLVPLSVEADDLGWLPCDPAWGSAADVPPLPWLSNGWSVDPVTRRITLS